MGEKKNRDKQNGAGHHDKKQRVKDREKRSMEVAKDERKKKINCERVKHYHNNKQYVDVQMEETKLFYFELNSSWVNKNKRG
jgi:hypothetical protein